MNGETLLKDVLAAYAETPLRTRACGPLSDKTRTLYRHIVRLFSQHVGRHSTVADLSERRVAEFGRAMAARGYKYQTVRQQVHTLHTLAKWLARRGVIEREPERPRVEELFYPASPAAGGAGKPWWLRPWRRRCVR